MTIARLSPSLEPPPMTPTRRVARPPLSKDIKTREEKSRLKGSASLETSLPREGTRPVDRECVSATSDTYARDGHKCRPKCRRPYSLHSDCKDRRRGNRTVLRASERFTFAGIDRCMVEQVITKGNGGIRPERTGCVSPDAVMKRPVGTKPKRATNREVRSPLRHSPSTPGPGSVPTGDRGVSTGQHTLRLEGG